MTMPRRILALAMPLVAMVAGCKPAALPNGADGGEGEYAALASRAARLLDCEEKAERYAAEAERLFLALGAVLHLARLRQAKQAP